MAWDAVREQLEAPPPLVHQDLQRARLKGYIEAQLADPDLSVDAIAQACGMSVRSVHRAFAADPAGSVSEHIWVRRLSQCAATLRDPEQMDRSITDICFSCGFNSTSHFSHLFKDQFGVAPRDYRAAIQARSALPTIRPYPTSQKPSCTERLASRLALRAGVA